MRGVGEVGEVAESYIDAFTGEGFARGCLGAVRIIATGGEADCPHSRQERHRNGKTRACRGSGDLPFASR